MNETPPTGSALAPDPPWMHRATEIVRIAARHRTGVKLTDLVALLPPQAPSDPSELGRWLTGRFPRGAVEDGVMYAEHRDADRAGVLDLAARAEQYVRSAQRLFEESLGRERDWLRCAAVTGSAAYGQAQAGDDCDLLVVTRPGLVWPFLLAAYLRFRLLPRGSAPAPRWCLNLVVDERRASTLYDTPQGFHVAREALLARAVLGVRYYGSLLRRASWIREEIPRLYGERVPPADSDEDGSSSAGSTVRVANLPIFLLLGAYVSAVGLVRNARLRRAGNVEKGFRTRISPHGLAFESVEFDRLRTAYRDARSAGE
ncbi:MAG TPA: hypothetical protein VML94_02245 [Thermoplasmata archaeon]|nr:hypothetical protein [Thermoplasmata archaeon]